MTWSGRSSSRPPSRSSPTDQVDQAVAAANDTGFGLCASVWSGDDELAGRVAEQLSAGTGLDIAHGMGRWTTSPHGGMGRFGLGIELGVEGMAAFTRPRVQATDPVIARRSSIHAAGRRGRFVNPVDQGRAP